MALRFSQDGGGGDEDDSVCVTEGGVTLFYIERQEDIAMDKGLCTITAFSSRAFKALASLAAGFKKGTCALLPHGRFEHTIQTKLGPKRLVRVVGIDEDSIDSWNLAAHFTIEDDAAVAYQPCPPANDATLADHVIARAILAFRSGGWEFSTSPTIESIMARRDYYGHGLTRDLFSAVEKWFLREWTLDAKEGVRTLQATQLVNAIVDGVPVPGGGGSGGGDGETGACRGLTAVTDKQLLYETLGFHVILPEEGTMTGMMSEARPKDEESMMIYPGTKHGIRKVFRSELSAGNGVGWRSCDYCRVAEDWTSRLKVCTGCLCERYYAGHYCRYMIWGNECETFSNKNKTYLSVCHRCILLIR